jgi:hypothetical protein
MLRRECRQPTARLLELALAPRAIPASGLVPRDGVVDEALEEVLLRGVGRPPDVLEGLVGLEELAAAHLLDTTQ